MKTKTKMNEKELIQEIYIKTRMFNETSVQHYLDDALERVGELQELKGIETFNETLDYFEEQVWGNKNECH